jgi:hypothetical protein
MGATAKDLHIDVMLSNVAIGYRPDGMIADMIAPIVRVPKQSDKYPIFSRADATRTEDDKRSPGKPANRITRSVSSQGFFCENYALAYPLTIEDRANADPVYVAEMINGNVRYTQDKLFLNWEVRVANQVTSSTNVGSSTAVGSAWTDYTNSDPLSDLNTAIDNVADATGKRPNRITFSEKSWRHFRRNEKLTNKIYGDNNGGGYATRQQVSQLLEIQEILVGCLQKHW